MGLDIDSRLLKAINQNNDLLFPEFRLISSFDPNRILPGKAREYFISNKLNDGISFAVLTRASEFANTPVKLESLSPVSIKFVQSVGVKLADLNETANNPSADGIILGRRSSIKADSSYGKALTLLRLTVQSLEAMPNDQSRIETIAIILDAKVFQQVSTDGFSFGPSSNKQQLSVNLSKLPELNHSFSKFENPLKVVEENLNTLRSLIGNLKISVVNEAALVHLQAKETEIAQSKPVVQVDHASIIREVFRRYLQKTFPETQEATQIRLWLSKPEVEEQAGFRAYIKDLEFAQGIGLSVITSILKEKSPEQVQSYLNNQSTAP